MLGKLSVQVLFLLLQVTQEHQSLLLKGSDLGGSAGQGFPHSSTRDPRHHVRITDFYTTESQTRFVCELSADHLDCYCSVVHKCWVRAGERAKVRRCAQQPVWKKLHIFFLFRLQPTRHHYSLAHSTAHRSSGQSTK